MPQQTFAFDQFNLIRAWVHYAYFGKGRFNLTRIP